MKNVIWAVTCDFQQCGILTSVDSDKPVQPPFKLKFESVAQQFYNIQATSKGSDQTACMHRLIWGFAGRTYQIVGNLVSWLNYVIILIILQQNYMLWALLGIILQESSNKNMFDWIFHAGPGASNAAIIPQVNFEIGLRLPHDFMVCWTQRRMYVSGEFQSPSSDISQNMMTITMIKPITRVTTW